MKHQFYIKRHFLQSVFFFLLITCKIAAQENTEICLLVRGDDMGSFASANQACLNAATKGIVRSIEVMTPCAWFPEAAKLLNENPTIDVGVHLILTSEWSNCKWRPLTCTKSLVDTNGYFYPFIWPVKDMPSNSIQEAKWDIKDIEAEFRAQIEIAKKCIPHITHISTHMGCAEWNKDITALLQRLAKEYHLYWGEPQTKPFPKMNAGNSDPVEKRIAAFIEALDKLEPGNTYLFVEHPAYDTPEMQTVGHKGYENVAKDRAGVTQMFTDKRVINFIKKKGIRLIGYNDVIKQYDNSSVKNDYYVAAYVWPSCHDDPKGRENLWPEGIGEWEVIKKGNPRFEGHYQPKQPLWGYEPDNNPKVVEKWIDAATEHGVNVFIYDWYWYDGSPFLESALNDGFLKAKNNEKMQFYIMWANHDVKKNYWNYHLHGDDNSLLWDAAVDWKNFQIIVERVIKQYFHKPNYFKINGEPVFAIFDIWKLMQSFGNSVEETRKALDYFRAEAKKAGFPGVHFQWTCGGGWLMSDEDAKAFAERIAAIGFNSITMYNMGGMSEDYIVYGTNSIKIREQWDKIFNIPFFPCTSVGWDDTPRFPHYGKENTVHYNRTPQCFATLLSKAKQYVDNHPDQPKLMVINAWNEWVEDSYLLPDMKYGYGYLEAVRDVMKGKYDY